MSTWTTEDREEAEKIMNNEPALKGEPVAHFYPEGEGCTVYDIQFAWKVTGTTKPIPLYTHPAELTDEEIWKLWVKHLNDDIIVFARAILKKAEEK